MPFVKEKALHALIKVSNIHATADLVKNNGIEVGKAYTLCLFCITV